MSIYNKGSEWRKWDLHFHTPSSYDYHDKSITNQQLIEVLKDNSIAVVAITDHHLIDTIRIKEMQKLASVENITVLPGIECCSESRGREPIHFIGIFSESSKLDYIWNEINSKANIAQQKHAGKADNEIHCKLEETCKLIRDLGGVVSIHAGDRSNSIENISHSLSVTTAEKKEIAKCIDIFEMGKVEDQVVYREKVFSSLNGRVVPMIMCSDNHDAKTNKYSIKEYCWIKADPTFKGLRQIIYDPEDRVFIGSEPEVLNRVANNKTRYIKALKINQKTDYKGENGIWFRNVNIEFNKELVAIIGNKGSGKSAISDTVGLLGNTYNGGKDNKNLSFLNNTEHKKFRQKGYAENFEAELIWEDGIPDKKDLDGEIDRTQLERVKYLPQNYFEALTNDLVSEGFERTLKSVIFLHIPEANRYKKTNFEELESFKSLSIESDLELLKEDVRKTCLEVINLERKKHKDNILRIENLIKAKAKELEEHNKVKPLEKLDPAKNKDVEIDKKNQFNFKRLSELNEKLENINMCVAGKNEQKNKLVAVKEVLQQINNDIKRFSKTLEDYKVRNRERFLSLELEIDSIIATKFDFPVIDKKIKTNSDELKEVESCLKDSAMLDFEASLDNEFDLKKARMKSLFVNKEEVESEIKKIKSELSRPEKEFQEYKESLRKWENVKQIIVGNPQNPSQVPESLSFYKSEKNYIENNLGSELKSKRDKLFQKVMDIFTKKKEIIELYKDFKESIDSEIKKDKDFFEKFHMDIDVSFGLERGFIDSFLGFINKSRKGTFYGISEGRRYLERILENKNLLDEKDLRNILSTIISYLEIDQREEVSEQDKEREILDQIEKHEDFYEFLFSLDYLIPKYELKLDNKSLKELSPGEKGALLLVFYLMIDKENIPLIIDQPEDNLDNKSVFQVLTHFMRFAKKRRQIIIVTHNPNLAVGADAEQIIYVNIDKKNKYEFSYRSGSIENPEINEKILDILEGTMPAFDKRRWKYKVSYDGKRK